VSNPAGSRGDRPKKSAQVKRLLGNLGHHPIPDPPVLPPPTKLPTPPRTLDAVGRKLWKDVVGGLLQLGILSQFDLAAIEGYCEAYQTAVRATLALQQRARENKQAGIAAPYFCYKAKDGGWMPYKEVGVKEKAWAALRMYAIEFGFTPASRSRVQLPTHPPAGPHLSSEQQKVQQFFGS